MTRTCEVCNLNLTNMRVTELKKGNTTYRKVWVCEPCYYKDEVKE